MEKTWHDEDWSKGILLGLKPDPNTGYRAVVWFEYTRALFNEIREGSLIAVRNFSDRPRMKTGQPDGDRTASYEEYTVLQIDQVFPWHYAIQDSGESGFPGFTTAAAESARQDWTDMDEINRDDVSRIKCTAIPLRLAFRHNSNGDSLPPCFPDRSMPMPGYEVRLLREGMTDAIINHGLEEDKSITLGQHVVQHEVEVRMQLPPFLRLHFGIFGYTGAGKSNLVSTLTRKALSREASPDGSLIYKTVLFDLMDEYTGLLIDQLSKHRYSQLIVAGRNALPKAVLDACIAVANEEPDRVARVNEASEVWARSLILPKELDGIRAKYTSPLSKLINDRKVCFFESATEQGLEFYFNLNGLINQLGPKAYGNQADFQTFTTALRADLNPLLKEAQNAEPTDRDPILDKILNRLRQELGNLTTDKARKVIPGFLEDVERQKGARGGLGRIAITPQDVARLLNFQPQREGHKFFPSLVVIIGETGERIAEFGRELVSVTFASRRERSILEPTIAFVFDEADVFIGYEERGRGAEREARMVDEATLIARRGRKFGLGLGLATQRIRYLDTSIMAQPHTYFISRLPRKSDRDAIAEAFAISDETLEQTFAFTVGQWLVASHDATGLKGTPFPVLMENANDRVKEWLDAFNTQQH